MGEHITVSIRQGATYPAIQAKIVDQYENVYDLSDVNAATFTLKDTGGTIIDGATCTISTDDDGDDVVIYDWVAGDTDEPGTYRGYFTLTFDTGEVMISPSINDFVVEIWEV
jgi:hypothetical protein